MMFRGRFRRGFTLVELLVVVAIIALLISILLPSLAKARELAKTTVCGTHLADVFKGIYMYAEDNDDQIPNFNEWWIKRGGTISGGKLRPNVRGFWAQKLLRYIKDPKVYWCPADLKPDWLWLGENQVRANTRRIAVVGLRTGPGDPVYDPQTGDYYMAPVSYVGNCNSWYKRGAGYHSRALTRFKFPTFFPLLGEGDRGRNDKTNVRYQCMEFVQHFCGNKIYKDPESGWTRHLGGSNMLFVDGHVAYLQTQGLLKYCTRTEFPVFDEARVP